MTDRDDDHTWPIDPDADETRALGQPPEPGFEQTRRISPAGGGPATHTERIRVPAEPPGLAAGLVAILVVAALLVGAALGYSQTDPSDEDVVARSLVGTDGGVLTFDGTGRLEIGSGALPTATSIKIRRTTVDRRVRLGAEGDPAAVTYEPGELEVYAFEPADLRFQQPVTIALPRRADEEAVLIDTPRGARVVPATPDGATLRFQTSSFGFDT